jgi:hypothetical protein
MLHLHFYSLLMEVNSWSVHSVMETVEKTVQNSASDIEKDKKARRSQADKVGKLKYLLQQNRELKADIGEIKVMLRELLVGLEPSLNYKQSIVEKLACVDEVDGEILQVLFESGSSGMLPKDVAAKLARFKIYRHQVSRRLLRMNRRLQKKIEKLVAEHRGWIGLVVCCIWIRIILGGLGAMLCVSWSWLG